MWENANSAHKDGSLVETFVLNHGIVLQFAYPNLLEPASMDGVVTVVVQVRYLIHCRLLLTESIYASQSCIFVSLASGTASGSSLWSD